MSIEIIAGIATAAFLGWAWLIARSAANDCNRRAAEHRANPQPRQSSWDGSAEEQMLHTMGEIGRSQPPY